MIRNRICCELDGSLDTFSLQKGTNVEQVWTMCDTLPRENQSEPAISGGSSLQNLGARLSRAR